MRRLEIAGRKLGRLTPLKILTKERLPSGHYHEVWECICDCGKVTKARRSSLIDGHTQSCGCWHRQRTSESHLTHGDSRPGKIHPLYRVWSGMKKRCNNPKYREYHLYGGRGIKVEWVCYEDFKRDMEPTYSPGLSIERKDNNGNYSKGNCCWATVHEQAVNRRTNVRLTWRGETFCLSQWAVRLGVKKQCLKDRYHAGWSTERMLTTPVIKNQ